MQSRVIVGAALLVACGGGGGAPEPPRAPVAKRAEPAAAVVAAPEREDFETAAVGAVPPGWAVAGDANHIAFAAARGTTGTVLEIVTADKGYGSILHPLDIARYRGKRLVISARASCELKVWWAHALIGVDVARPGARGYGDRSRTADIGQSDWHDYVAVVDVAADATGLDLVVSANGAATIQIDDISIRVLGTAGIGDEPPRALAGRALDNVTAFARLYGLVRYFHPSDQAAALDQAAWEHFVVRGVRAVETASDPAALQARLAALFAPIAPTVAIRRDGDPAPAVTVVDGPATHWIHSGLGIEKDSVYRSTRGAGSSPVVTTLVGSIDGALVRGRQLHVTLRGRGTIAGDRGDAGLWISEQRGEGKPGFYTEPEQQPAIGTAWTTISVEGTISADATALSLGVQVISNADVWLEPPVLTADGKPVAIPAWGTSKSGLAASWTRSGSTAIIAVAEPGCESHRPCLHLSQRDPAPPDLRPWSGALGGGVAASIPLELATHDGRTVPPSAAPPPPTDPIPLLVSDRATRLASVIIAWNIFEHFYPYFDVVGTDWKAKLPGWLAEAALDDGPAALHATLRRLVHELHDGHGRVGNPSEDRTRVAPWLWDQVEGKLAITQVAEACACDLAPGDVVVAIDGAPIDQVIAQTGALTSAATEQFRRDKVLSTLRGGPTGARRRLTVQRAGTTHDVEVPLVAPSAAPIEKRPANGAAVAPGIRYVDMDNVTADQWKQMLPDLATAQGVICDMRGYVSLPFEATLSHFSKQPLRSARWMVPTPARPDREALTFRRSDWGLIPAAPFLGNIVFLTDGRAVSAAETFMGIVEAYKLGPIVGSATAGTNGNINPFTLPGGYLLWWTGMQVLKHDGSRHHGVGILPTVPAERTLAGVAAQRDEVLERGIEVARQRAKPPGRP